MTGEQCRCAALAHFTLPEAEFTDKLAGVRLRVTIFGKYSKRVRHVALSMADDETGGKHRYKLSQTYIPFLRTS